MINEERQRIFDTFSKYKDEKLKEQAEATLAFTSTHRKAKVVQSIIDFKRTLTEKQRAYLIYFIIEYWSSI
jgi:hypothetical protein